MELLRAARDAFAPRRRRVWLGRHRAYAEFKQLSAEEETRLLERLTLLLQRTAWATSVKLDRSSRRAIFELSGAEVVQVLEEAVANYQDNGGSDGSYPYGSAIRWDLNEGAPAGSRFTNVEVRADDGTWSAIDLGATYVVVTNSFLAAGGDGWFTFGTATAEGRTVDTFINYAQGFIDWLEQDAGGVASVPAPENFSTQSFISA